MTIKKEMKNEILSKIIGNAEGTNRADLTAIEVSKSKDPQGH